MAEGDNTFPTDSARDRSALKHDWKKMINDITFENNVKFSSKFFNRIFIRFYLLRKKRKKMVKKREKRKLPSHKS